MKESRKDSLEQRQASVPAPKAEQAAAGGSTGVQEKAGSAPARVDRLPPYRVLLHNDDVNDMGYVIDTICDLTPLSEHKAAKVMLEAHKSGLSLMLLTHRERAELYIDQFATKGLTVTIESAE